MAETKKSIWKRWYMIVLYVFVGLIIIGSLLLDSSNEEKKSNVMFESVIASQINDCKQDSESVSCKPALDIIKASAVQEKNILSVEIETNGEIPKKEELKTGAISPEAYQYTLMINPSSSSGGAMNYEQLWVLTLEANKNWEAKCFTRPLVSCSKDISFRFEGRKIILSGEVKTNIQTLEIASSYGDALDSVEWSPEITDKITLR